MPYMPLGPCAYPRCPNRRASIKQRFCETHQKQTRKVDDARRGSAASRGYDAAWERLRVAWLNQHPLCEFCQERDKRVEPATVVDHIAPIVDAPSRRLDWTNLRSLCKHHHDAHTARTVGYGRRRG